MRVLITSTDSMMIQFLVPHVLNLVENGVEVDIACSEVKGRMNELREQLEEKVKIFQVELVRNPLSLSNIKGLKQLKKIISNGKYDLVWTNEPVMGVMTRLASKKARKKGMKVLYMCHGFHFFKGAPLLNWMLWYPIEKFMTRYTDTIVNVNDEDYNFSSKHFKRCKVFKINGVGVNVEKFYLAEADKDFRVKNGINDDALILLTVAELNKNKNQIVIFKALEQLKNLNIHYVLCGIGDKKDELENYAIEHGFIDKVHFLGYVKNMPVVYKACDVFCFPSLREGLNFSVIEAMSCGLPIVSSNRRGIVNQDGINGFSCEPTNVMQFASAIEKLYNSKELREKFKESNLLFSKDFCLDFAKKQIIDIINFQLK